jgi:peptidoglycan L-alanyl-D-glutamate endopeptidase CwlK
MESMSWGMHVVQRMFPLAIHNVIKYFPLIEHAFDKYNVRDVQLRLVGYATIAAETAGFSPIKERESRFNTLRIPYEFVGIGESAKYNLYDGRKNLGHTSGIPGDGERYMGRGFVQLTGRHNYMKYGIVVGKNLVAEPDLACDAKVAAELLAAFIVDHRHHIEDALKKRDLRRARKAVNGGVNGLDAFVKAYKTGLALITARDPRDLSNIA